MRVNAWCFGEANILSYALNALPAMSYNDPQGPTALYRGDGRDVTFYCNQFINENGLSIDDCVSRVFKPNAIFSISPFWSTTPLSYVISRFTGCITFNILPDPSSRTAWVAKPIANFSVDVSQDEYLYTSGARFVVLSKACVINPNTGTYMWSKFPLFDLNIFDFKNLFYFFKISHCWRHHHI